MLAEIEIGFMSGEKFLENFVVFLSGHNKKSGLRLWLRVETGKLANCCGFSSMENSKSKITKVCKKSFLVRNFLKCFSEKFHRNIFNEKESLKKISRIQSLNITARVKYFWCACVRRQTKKKARV